MRKILALALVFGSGCGLSPRSVFGVAHVADEFDEAGAPSLPTPNPEIDPLTFEAPADFISVTSTIGGFGDKRQARDAVLKPCAYVAPGPEAPGDLVPSIDGNLGEWPATSLMAIDRTGDGLNADAGQDLRALYIAESKEAIYVGVRLASRWSGTTENEAKLYVDFDTVKPQGGANAPAIENKARFLLRDGDKLYNDAEYPNAADPEKFLAVVGPEGIELKFARSGGIIELGDIYQVRVYVAKTPADEAKEQIGSYIAGLFADYACMRTMPDGAMKMFVMRRYPGLNAQAAESFYRGVLAGAAEVDATVGDGFDTYDTINVSVVNDGASTGGAHPTGGLFIGKPTVLVASQAFIVGARMYAQLLAGVDYKMLTDWMKAGFGEWSMLRSLKRVFGSAIWKRLFDGYAATVTGREAQGGVVHLAGVASPYDEIAQKKGALLFELWAANAPFEQLRDAYDRRTALGATVTNEDQFLERINSVLEAASGATLSANAWRGWVKFGEYNESPAKPADFSDYYGR